MPPRTCLEGALTELVEPTITVREKGAFVLLLPTTSLAPVGRDAKRSLTVFGSSRKLSVSVSPLESVAISLNSRYAG